ncbi:MAG: MerR family transcriptional regulator [Deltaproteobacteria bacterium]|nr:MerR family transcriptional regulator [Deltaproteobacteria bacterium]
MTTPNLMTLSELADAAAGVVSDLGQVSGRIREQPDVRTIRYYTTLGLIDRAAEMRGRTAYYSDRHLRQLVAIKRLQSEGHSLQEIQARLVGISPQALVALAPLPDRPATADAEKAPARASFWRERAAAPAPPAKVNETSEASPLKTLQTVALSTGVLLTIDTTAPLGADELRAILEAARPLLRVLEQQRGESSSARPHSTKEKV